MTQPTIGQDSPAAGRQTWPNRVQVAMSCWNAWRKIGEPLSNRYAWYGGVPEFREQMRNEVRRRLA